jgi:hypothetical protein
MDIMKMGLSVQARIVKANRKVVPIPTPLNIKRMASQALDEVRVMGAASNPNDPDGPKAA